MTTKVRFDHIMQFSKSQQFQDVQEKVVSKQITFSQAFDILPETISNGWLSFMNKTHSYLLFTKQDLYPMFPNEKVDTFLKVFSCKPEIIPQSSFDNPGFK